MSRPFGNHRHRRRPGRDPGHALPSLLRSPQEWRRVVEARLVDDKGPGWVEANQELLKDQWRSIEQTFL
jgi:hypothetical protein